METRPPSDPEESDLAASLTTAEVETQPSSMLNARNRLIAAYTTAQEKDTLPPLLSQSGVLLQCSPIPVRTSSSPFVTSGRKDRYVFSATSALENGNLSITLNEVATQKGERQYPSYRYVILDNGTILLDTEHGEPKIVTDSAEHSLLVKSMATMNHALSLALFNQELSTTEPPKKVRHKIGNAAVILTIVGVGVGVAGYFGWSTFIDQPGKADDARRTAYDLEQHTLSTTPTMLKGLPFSTVPEEEFTAIPTYKNGDTFISPRQIQLDADGCALLPVATPEGTTISIVVSDQADETMSSIGALQTAEGLFLCTPEAPAEDATPPRLAIQLTPTLSK